MSARAGFSTADLRAEMLRFGIDYRHCRRLEVAGVEGRFVCELSAHLMIGAARVNLSRDGALWEPHGPHGSLLLAVFEGGELIDIAAFTTAQPDRVALRIGQGAVLGEERIEQAERAALAGRRVALRVFADPMEWLRHRGEGVCVVDWKRALPRLRGLGERVSLRCAPGFDRVVAARIARGDLPGVVPDTDEGLLSLAERIGRTASSSEAVGQERDAA
jgi:hypothetical protein